MSRILVVGGAGYIGSHAAKMLRQKGHEPIVYDNLVYGHEWAVRWGPLEMGSLGDRTTLDRVLKKYRPDAVMHFAAYAYVGESVQNPSKYYHNNVVETLHLLDAMVAAQIPALIFSSTCATYGIPASVPITEAEPQKPVNPYGRTKWMVEQILDDYETAHGLRSVCLRYFNAAGADPEGEIGEDHDPETHLIPLALQAAAGKRDALTVFGEDYPTPDGTCIRDYIHVTDLADAHWLALEYLAGAKGSLRLNLGNGKGYSVREVIRAVEKATGRSVPTVVGPRRAGDPPELVGSAAAAMEKLNWRPLHSGLDAIVESAWKWHSARWGINF